MEESQDYPIVQFEYGKIEIRGNNGFVTIVLPGSDASLQTSFTINRDKLGRTLQNLKEAIRPLEIEKKTKSKVVGTAYDKLTDYFLNAPADNYGKAQNMVNAAQDDQNNALKVFNLLQDQNSELVNASGSSESVQKYFLDTVGSCYAWVKFYDGQFESHRAIPVESKEFQGFASLMFYQMYNKIAGKDAIKSAVGLIQAHIQQRHDVETYKLFVRYALLKGELFVDVGSADQKIWIIKPDPVGNGVEESTQQEPIFKRYKIAKELVHPDPDGKKEDLEAFVKFYNLKDDTSTILGVGFIGASMIPGIPHAVLDVYGSQGATKSSFEKAIKRLIDPSTALTVRLATDIKELTQTLAHRYFTIFDNVTSISQAQFDTICRVATGESDTKRQLYSDDSDFPYDEFRHVVALNGINDLMLRPDASERSLRIELKRVEEETRLADADVEVKLEELLPKALGAAFHGLSYALKFYSEIKQELKGKLPRMADFAIWAEAFCRGLGYTKNEFFEKYKENTKIASLAALENNAVVELVSKLLEGMENSTWTGTASELLTKLKEMDDANGQTFGKNKQIPKGPTKLSQKLNELATDMKLLGYSIERGKTPDKAGRKLITIKYEKPSPEVGRQATDATEPPKEENQAQKSLESSDASIQALRHASDKSSSIHTQNKASVASDASLRASFLRNDLIFSKFEKGKEGTFVRCKEHIEGLFRVPEEWDAHVSTYHNDKASQDEETIVYKPEWKGLRDAALDTFKRLSGESKDPVEDKTFYDEMEKLGKFSKDQAEKTWQDMWKTGVIFEVRAHFFKKA